MIQKLIRQLAQENLDEQVVENPYCHPICCDNLEKYLSALWKIQPKILLVGEAPGYRGCALTGVPFTAEYNMMQMENEVLEPVQYLFMCGFSSQILPMTRKKYAGILTYGKCF